jgi:uncharacterized protein YciI
MANHGHEGERISGPEPGVLTMWYAVMSEDNDDSVSARLGARQAHISRLTELRDAGRLLIAGPHPAVDTGEPGSAGFTGSLVVVDFPSLEAAEEWAEKDPYKDAGVYRNVVVKPFKLVLP